MHTQIRTKSLGDTIITFPALECWNAMTKVATIAANIGKKRILCRISLGLLKDQFDASEEAPMRSVALHRRTIQTAARKLIENERYEQDGSILIRKRDL